MFLPSNQRLQNIYRIIAVVLLIAYPIIYFWLNQGSAVAFAAIYLSCFIILNWYAWKLIDGWNNSKPLINESILSHEADLSAAKLKLKVEQLVQRRRWRVKNQSTEEGICSTMIETPISLYSLGENIRITASVTKGYAESVRIESSPKIPTTEVDDGRNQANVEAVRSALETTLQPID